MKIENEKAFENIIRENYPWMVGYVSLILSEEEAQDVVQDIFAALWVKRHRLEFNDKNHLCAYLRRTAKSRSIDRFRRKTAGGGYRFFSQLRLDELEWFQENGEDLLEKIGREDLYQQVLSVVEELPETRRDVFKLSYLNGFSAKDISQTTGLPVRTVENHLYQALKFLRGKFALVQFIWISLSL